MSLAAPLVLYESETSGRQTTAILASLGSLYSASMSVPFHRYTAVVKALMQPLNETAATAMDASPSITTAREGRDMRFILELQKVKRAARLGPRCYVLVDSQLRSQPVNLQPAAR